MASVQIRPSVIDDLPSLTDMYNHYILHTAITFDIEPYTVESRKVWYSQFAETGRHQLLVAEFNNEVIGFACSAPFKQKQAYETSVEVSIYLKPDRQGQGVGKRLYEALFKALENEDVHRAYAGISLPNEASRTIHQMFGFTSVGIYREAGRKFGKYWDIEQFEKAIN